MELKPNWIKDDYFFVLQRFLFIFYLKKQNYNRKIEKIRKNRKNYNLFIEILLPVAGLMLKLGCILVVVVLSYLLGKKFSQFSLLQFHFLVSNKIFDAKDRCNCWGKLKFRINFLKNLFFSKKNFFIFFKFNKLTLKSVEANFVSKCFTFFLVKYKKLFLKKLKYQKK